MDNDHGFGSGHSGATGFPFRSGEETSLLRRMVRRAGPPAPRSEDPVFIRDHHGLQRIDRASIGLVRAEGNYVEIHVLGRRYVLRNSLCEVIVQLGLSRFAQVNRSTAVNIQRLERVDADSVQLDGQVITLSRCFRCALIQRLRVLGGR